MNNSDVIVICSNCGKTKLKWETVCPHCKDVDESSIKANKK